MCSPSARTGGATRAFREKISTRATVRPELDKAVAPASEMRTAGIEGQESARIRGKAIGGATVTDPVMLAMALHLRQQGTSLRDSAAQLVITTGKKRGQHPSPATVMRMLRDHDEQGARLDRG